MDRLEIFNYIASNIGAYDSTIYVAQRYEPIPKQMPCAFIQQISKVRTREYATLDNTDEQYRLTFEAQVFCRTLEDAYDLMKVIEDSFKSISFFEEGCEPIDNIDTSVSRIVARFTAQVGANGINDAP